MAGLLRSLCGMLFVCVSATSLLPAQVCHGQVRINEILADPASDWDGDAATHFKNDEWVEIVNTGATAVALDAFRLSDASDTFRFGFSGTLSPGQQLVVYGSESVGWESTEGLSTVGLSLNNSGDTVRLWQLSGPDTLLVDEYSYASHETLDDRSTGRVPDGGDTWFIFDALNPYAGADPPLATGCAPTPGGPNACPTAVESATWSAVKLLFDAAGERP
ncbi:MAG: lamin tail domain-containing protein [Candidatus Krumholzibacteriia bacterium]